MLKMNILRLAKSCCRIIFFTFMSICCIAMGIVVFRVVDYCLDGRFENRIASLRDLSEYVVNSDAERKSWAFSPHVLDDEHTNLVYVAEFCPRLARKHDICFSCNEAEVLDADHIEKLGRGVPFQIVIRHVQTGVVYDKVFRVGFPDPRSKAIRIYTFSTADLPWRYTDRSRIEITLMQGLPDAWIDKTELWVCESVPFY